jgi:hypothetical protein
MKMHGLSNPKIINVPSDFYSEAFSSATHRKGLRGGAFGCGTASRKVAGLIPDGVIRNFH